MGLPDIKKNSVNHEKAILIWDRHTAAILKSDLTPYTSKFYIDALIGSLQVILSLVQRSLVLALRIGNPCY